MSRTIKILFLGDIVGRPGRFSVKYFLSNVEQFIGYQPDFIIANCENASHGFGLTEKNYNDLIGYGIDVLTSGNHIWDRKEIFVYIDKADKLLRPQNYPYGTPGKGVNIFFKDDYSVGIINLLGRVFMESYESPWEVIKSLILNMQQKTPIVIVDFHAEATAEKIAFGYYLSELGITALIGTHTHVQTADEKIISSMAYISDVGYCGATDSVIGMDINTSIKKLTTLLPVKYEIGEIGNATINGITITVDPKTGISSEINRINFNIDLKKLIEEDKL